MVHDDFAVSRQLHVEFGALTAAQYRVGKCCQRVFGAQFCTPAMGDIPGPHGLSPPGTLAEIEEPYEHPFVDFVRRKNRKNDELRMQLFHDTGA